MAGGDYRNVPDLQPELCPICMDTYKNPKILPCSHTMCRKCLEDLLASGYNADELVCPICRKKNKVPTEGVGKFMPNYYVPTSSEESVTSTCNVCDTILTDFQKKSGRCSYCDGQMCASCYQKHHHPENEMRGFRRTASQDDEFSDGLELDGSHRSMRDNLMLQLQGKAQSIITGRMVSSFQCEQQSAQSIKITKIVVTKENKMWILVENGPFIIKYDSQGTELDRKFVDGRLLDIALHIDGSLLMVLENYHSVMSYNRDSQIREYVSTTDSLSPQCILMLPTGCLVVTAVNRTSVQQESIILVYDPQGTIINSIQCNQRGVAYGTIVSLASNLKHGQICIADDKRQSVFFLREGVAPLTYVRPNGFPTRNRGGCFSNPKYRGFKPKSMSCDSKGNLFVYDDASGMILVLNSSAKLQGLVLPNDTELAGNPNCIAIDCQDRLLVGDEKSGKVRIYETEAIYNNLGQIDEDAGAFFASMQQHLTDAGGGGIQELVDISSRMSVNPDMFLNAVLNHQQNYNHQ